MSRQTDLEDVMATVQYQSVRLRLVLAVQSVQAKTLTLWKKPK